MHDLEKRSILSVFSLITQFLLAPLESFLLKRVARSRTVKEMRWLTGITGYTLMGMVRQSWLTVKVRHVRLLVNGYVNVCGCNLHNPHHTGHIENYKQHTVDLQLVASCPVEGHTRQSFALSNTRRTIPKSRIVYHSLLPFYA